MRLLRRSLQSRTNFGSEAWRAFIQSDCPPRIAALMHLFDEPDYLRLMDDTAYRDEQTRLARAYQMERGMITETEPDKCA